ncbi:23877_t:CDS:2, partial [Racocetra persica]
SDHSTTLMIEDIVDLMTEKNSRPSVKTAQAITSANLDYDLHDILNCFLEQKNQENNNHILAATAYIISDMLRYTSPATAYVTCYSICYLL